MHNSIVALLLVDVNLHCHYCMRHPTAIVDIRLISRLVIDSSSAVILLTFVDIYLHVLFKTPMIFF